MLLWFAKVDWFILQIATSAHTRNQIFGKVAGDLPIDLT